jgi:hypothetical protein
MTTTGHSAPAAFTSHDFAARMSRVVSSAMEKGLAGGQRLNNTDRRLRVVE